MSTAEATEFIRSGSPFFGESRYVAEHVIAASHGLHDIGPARYVAWGAVVAAAVVLPLAILAAIYFPIGAIAIAAMCGVLSVVGLSSPQRKSSAVLLVLHTAILCWSAMRL